jgi:hypothetical protein
MAERMSMVFDLIGFVATLIVGGFCVLYGFATIQFIGGFTGKLSWGGLALLVFGLGLVVVAFWYGPISVTIEN